MGRTQTFNEDEVLQKAQELFVSFKDNGEGIVLANQERVFDPFYTTKEVGSGVGLGLSISYGIITNHDGRIELKSEEGKGSEFIVYLPITSSP